MINNIITAEAVGVGHPDKICDQLADLILDAALLQDPNAHVACEVMVVDHNFIVGGEMTTSFSTKKIKILIEELLYDILKYDRSFKFKVFNFINKQSSEINAMVSSGDKLGAGDIGVVWGYATNETPTYMPLPFVLASGIVKYLNNEAHHGLGLSACLKPDCKCQVSVAYNKLNQPEIKTIVVNIQHSAKVSLDDIRDTVARHVHCYLNEISNAGDFKINFNYKLYVNKNGTFIKGGSEADTGLTGRKLMCDTYGSLGLHGGGAFSGKDYTKVDRTGAYWARYIAKNMVAAGTADKMAVQLTYNIGDEKPMAVKVDTYGTNKISMEKIYKIINRLFDAKLSDIVKKFDMKNLNYTDYSIYGHFGNDDAPWENDDMVAKIEYLIERS